MRYKSILVIVCFSCSIFSSALSAQSLWGKLKNRVQNEVENVVTGKVARKAGEKAGEATDAVLNPEQDQDQKNQTVTEPNQPKKRGNESATTSNNPLKGLGGMMSALQQPVAIADQYEFELTIVASHTLDGKESSMKQGFSESAFMVDTDTDSKVVMDLDNKAIIMINKKEKTKTAMSTQLIKQMAKMGGRGAQAAPVSVGSIKSTGQSKNILGYEAKQWIFDNGDETGEVWISDEIDFDFIGFNQRLMNVFGTENSQAMLDFTSLKGEYPRGLPLESKVTTNGKKGSHYLVKDISRKPFSLSLDTYKTQSLMNGL